MNQSAKSIVPLDANGGRRGRAMPEKRRRFDREFREGAVRIVRETGKPIAQVAADLHRVIADLRSRQDRLLDELESPADESTMD